MFIQSMLLAILVLTLGLAITTTSLISAKAMLVHRIAAHSADAAQAGTIDFVHGLRDYIRIHGVAGLAAIQNAKSQGALAPLCGDGSSIGIGSGPGGGAPGASPDSVGAAAGALRPRAREPIMLGPACPYSYTVSAVVTGDQPAAQVPGGGNLAGAGTNETAQNEQQYIREQRISAVVTTTLESSDGSQTFGTRTRELTLRVFQTAPYAIVSGVRDLATVNGISGQAQGDSGGSATFVVGSDPFSGASASSQNTVPTPNPGRPAQDQVTYVQVQYECATQNPDLVFEKTESGGEVAGNQQVGNDGLPWGVQANTDAYELPCTDQTNSIVTPPPVPNGNLDSQSWQNGNQNAVPLPQ